MATKLCPIIRYYLPSCHRWGILINWIHMREYGMKIRKWHSTEMCFKLLFGVEAKAFEIITAALFKIPRQHSDIVLRNPHDFYQWLRLTLGGRKNKYSCTHTVAHVRKLDNRCLLMVEQLSVSCWSLDISLIKTHMICDEMLIRIYANDIGWGTFYYSIIITVVD